MTGNEDLLALPPPPSEDTVFRFRAACEQVDRALTEAVGAFAKFNEARRVANHAIYVTREVELREAKARREAEDERYHQWKLRQIKGDDRG